MSEQAWTYVDTKLPTKTGWYIVYALDFSQGSQHILQNINGIMFSKFNADSKKWSIEKRAVNYGCVKAWHRLPDIPRRYRGKKNGDKYH